jgi:glycosyltransferase involved in cell wall biosynthesis
MPEIVNGDECGVVLKDLTSDSLAQCVMDLIDDVPQLQLLSKASRCKVASEYNWDTVATKILTALERA